MKSFWTCCVAASLLLASPAAMAAKGKPRKPDELINVLLSPGYAQWLVGPIHRIASQEEVEAYLAIPDDDQARRFIDEFWSRRPGTTGIPGLSLRQLFLDRAEEADKRFTEAAYPGRRTDRGAIHVIYGEPREVRYERPRRQREAPIEVWVYDQETTVGIDGSRPERAYHFQKRGDLTSFARPSSLPRRF